MKNIKLISLILSGCMIFEEFLLMQPSFGQNTPTKKESPEDDGLWEMYEGIDNIEAKDIPAKGQVQNIIQASHEYNYASFGKKNPFIPPLISSHMAKIEIPVISVLQNFKLDQLNVVGIWILENNARKALITTEDSHGIIASVGDSIGNRGGKIVSIESDVVKVREFSLAPDGTRQFEDYNLRLGKDLPDEDEKIVIRSTKSRFFEGKKDDGADFLESTNKEMNRLNSISDMAAEGMKINLPAKNKLPTTNLPTLPSGINMPAEVFRPDDMIEKPVKKGQ